MAAADADVRGDPGPKAGREPPDAFVVGTLVVTAILIGCFLRAWAIATDVGMLDSDEAVVGLMARHILDGELPLFYWGQFYGGPHEAVLTAGVFAVAGSSTVALKLVPALLAGVASILTWRVGRRTVGEPAATVAACLLWIWPAVFVWWSVKAVGFYEIGLVLGLGVILLALRLRERESPFDVALGGLLVGLAWWATPQTVYLIAPALAWLVVGRPRLLRWAPLALVTAGAGALPWLVHNVRNDWVSLHATGAPAAENGYLDHLRVFFTDALPRALGVHLSGGELWLPPVLGQVCYVALLALFAYGAYRLRGPARLIMLVAVAYPFLFALSPFSWFVDIPRYLVFLSPVAALLLARGMAALPVVPLLVSFTTALAFSVGGLAVMSQRNIGANFAPDVRTPYDTAPVLDYLESNGIDAAWADYWLAYRLTFESDEQIVVAPFRGIVRRGEYDAMVRAHPRPAYVFVQTSSADPLFAARLDELGIGYRRTIAGGFVVYEPDVNVAPEAVEEIRGLGPRV